MECWQCGAPGAEYLCSRCRGVRFCGDACQRAAWRRHKPDCRAAGGDASLAGESPSLATPRTPAPPAAAEVAAPALARTGLGAAGTRQRVAAAAPGRRPLVLFVYPNIGVLQGDVQVRLERDASWESFRAAVGSVVLGGAAAGGVRLFSTEGEELQALDGLERCASEGVVASDGPGFRSGSGSGRGSQALAEAIARPRRYDPGLVGRQAPRIAGDDPELPCLLRCHAPVIVEGSGVGGRAPELWDFDYLGRHLAGTDRLCVLEAEPGAADRFMYYSIEAKDNPCGYRVQRTTTRRPKAFADFAREAAEARKRRAGGGRAPYLYLQSALLCRRQPACLGGQPVPGAAQPVGGFGETWGRRVQKDISEGFRLDRLRELAGGRELDSCQLFCGLAGGYTPMHFDSEDNLFLQVCGWKRILLFHPKYFDCLYPYPVHHPQDRSSRVDLGAPDLERFPRFASLRGCAVEAHLGPGDLLHIPPCWWHQVEMLPSSSGEKGDESVSLNFWYAPPTWYRGDPTSGSITWDDPLAGHGRVLFLRYVEKVVAETAGPRHVREVLQLCLDSGPAPAAGPLRAAVDAVLGSVRIVFTSEAAERAVFVELLEGRFAGLLAED